jgi:hypothetical protein
MRLFLLSFLLLVAGGSISTTSGSSIAAPKDAAATNADAHRALRRQRRRSRLGFYESRPDNRKCASPFCGGAFVRPIDGTLIKCPGDKKATVECYVGAMRYPVARQQPQQPTQNSSNTTITTSSLVDDETMGDGGTTIVFGRIVPGKYDGSASDINDFVLRKHGKAVSNFLQQVSIVLYFFSSRQPKHITNEFCRFVSFSSS